MVVSYFKALLTVSFFVQIVTKMDATLVLNTKSFGFLCIFAAISI